MPLKAEQIDQAIAKGLSVAKTQYLALAKELEAQEWRLPLTFEQNELKTCAYKDWTSGFFGGSLWYLYKLTQDEDFRHYAHIYTRRVEQAKTMRTSHDVGFMLNSGFGNGYRLTGDPYYMDVMKEGADNLSTRFNPVTKVIKSWRTRPAWQYPVIIDNMMNLELLCHTAKIYNDQKLLDIANTHAHTTMKNHFRPDGSSYHVVSYDTITGNVEVKQTHQGYSNESSWSRGQSWALYGFTMMYRETGNKVYLEQAKKVAGFILNNPHLPTDGIPYWDYDAPGQPNAQKDASAAAIMASAFIELSQYCNDAEKEKMREIACRILTTLSSPTYLAEPGTNGGFILKHSVGNYNSGKMVDVPLSYADYYYLEAIQRWEKLQAGKADRQQWVALLTKITRPVLENISKATLHKNMPFESTARPERRITSYLEAFGRTICGIAPWLELGPDNTEEGVLRKQFIDMARKGIASAVDPNSPDHLDFSNIERRQPLVDAAFLCQGIMRAPEQLRNSMTKTTRNRLVKELKGTRAIKPSESNWVLFTSMVETTLLDLTGECDTARLNYGINRFMRDGWYKGDGLYGDGPQFHLDYYNSYVIQPMLVDILQVLKKNHYSLSSYLPKALKREQRFAVQLERMISPEGSYPPLGRSITYRFASFQALSHTALLKNLAPSITPGQVRTALTAVMNRQFNRPGTFDKDGWLTIGFAGHQQHMSETYINTGSEYMCTVFFLPLGLHDSDPFWQEPYQEWTGLKAWKGIDVGADKALKDK